MSYSKRFLPSTSMLMAFDSAAKTGSFTGAAKELDLTQGAISRQISALERQLDVVLFRRIGRNVSLTYAGKTYAKEIKHALQSIRNASLNVMTNPLGGALNLAILPTFGTRWLMPRFPSFLKDNPDITVNFVTKLSSFDFHSEDLHAAIHFGLPEWPNTKTTYLMGEESVPVCSPSFRAQNSIISLDDLSSAPLLHIASRKNAWSEWFNLNGVSLSEEQGMVFEQFSITAQAANTGLGAALLPKFLIQNELERGELEIIFDNSLISTHGYHLVIPIENKEYAPVVAFQRWLLRMIDT